MIAKLAVCLGSGSGPEAQITVSWAGRDGDRQQYRYAVRDADGEVLDRGEDLRSGSGDPVDHVDILRCLLTFLIADGESYARYEMGGRGEQPPDGYLFNIQTAAWAYQVNEELVLAREELDCRP